MAAWAAGVGLLALVAAGGFARWSLAPGRVAESLNAVFQSSSDLRWATPSGAAFRILPWPNLELFDARINDTSGVNVAAAPEARLDLSLLDLVHGRLRPVRAALVNPIATVGFRKAFSQRGGEAVLAALRELGGLSSLSVSNGVLRLVDKERGVETMIDSVQGRLDGLKAGDRPRLVLSAVWRDTPFNLGLSLSNAENAVKGKPSPFAVALVSPAGKVEFTGEIGWGANPKLAGDLSASTHSLASVARLFRVPPPSFLSPDDAAVVAKLEASQESVALGEATLTSGGQTAQGALELAEIRGRTSVSGTLDAERLAIAPFFGPPARVLDPSGAWSVAAFDFRLPHTFDLDLRLSARSLDIYGLELTNAAASAILKDGDLTLNLLEATLGGGRLAAETRLSCVERDLRLDGKAKLSDATLSALAGLGWPALAGQANLEVAIVASGESPAAAVSGMTGTGSISWKQAVISGFNLEEALRRSQRQTGEASRDMRGGQTAIDELSAGIVIDQGVAHIIDGQLTAQGVAANLKGDIHIAARTVNLQFDATQTDSAGEPSKDAARLSVALDGPWFSPAIRRIDAPGKMDAPLDGSP